MADTLLTQSAIDRLQSAAYELIVEGESYRRRQKPQITPESGSDLHAGGELAHEDATQNERVTRAPTGRSQRRGRARAGPGTPKRRQRARSLTPSPDHDVHSTRSDAPKWSLPCANKVGPSAWQATGGRDRQPLASMPENIVVFIRQTGERRRFSSLPNECP